MYCSFNITSSLFRAWCRCGSEWRPALLFGNSTSYCGDWSERTNCVADFEYWILQSLHTSLSAAALTAAFAPLAPACVVVPDGFGLHRLACMFVSLGLRLRC
mmetsp:Transcript_18882/g.42199  ORF Transcript_18882/g.42199 Transcript_18882/m.42199 type:complete len:102 (+) Transcript_18882:814-1119(+)